jgi:methylase of polypeptide subunit release factors
MTHADVSTQASPLPALRLMRAMTFEMDGRSYPLVLPGGVYAPDTWTRMLVRGLLRHLADRPDTRVVVEVGAGSGIVPVIIGQSGLTAAPIEYVGLDLNEVACEAARLNLQLNGGAFPCRFVPGGHLLERLPADLPGRVDILAANLPQVPAAGLGEVNLNDYYRPQPRSGDGAQRFELCGMGLLFDLLMAARSIMSPTGTVVLTVAGRCGGTELSALFSFCGMSHDVLHHAIVRQDPNTSIEHFRRTEEASDIRFAFYADRTGQQPISATAAARAAERGPPVYHDLYAIAARRSARRR